MFRYVSPNVDFFFSALYFQEADKLDKFGVCGFGFFHWASPFTCCSNSFSCLSNILVASWIILSGGSTPVDSIFIMKAFFSHSTFMTGGFSGQASRQSMQRLHAKRSRISTLFSFIVYTFFGHMSTHFAQSLHSLIGTSIFG